MYIRISHLLQDLVELRETQQVEREKGEVGFKIVSDETQAFICRDERWEREERLHFVCKDVNKAYSETTESWKHGSDPRFHF